MLFGVDYLSLFGIGWAVIIPLLGIVAILACHRWPNVRDAVVLVTAGTLLSHIITIVGLYLEVEDTAFLVAEPISSVPFRFALEPLGLIFALIASSLWLVTSLYAIGYMRGNKESNQTRFYAYFAFSIASTMVIALADNLFTLFIGYEVLTLCTYPLVTHAGTENARKAGRTYLGILLSTSMLGLLVAIIWTWQLTGTTNFALGGILEGKADPTVTAILTFLFFFGIGKAALMPFHRWLPAAMVAPTPVSALLHAVAVVKAGVFSVVKIIVYTLGVDNLTNMISQQFWAGGWLVYAAGITIVLASVAALKQDSLKKRLAYSTISQLSYVILGAALLVPKSITAAIFHIAAHAFGKITLFFTAGAIYTAAHKSKVSELDGIGKHMPWTMLAFTIGSLSMIGIPPAAGFITKYYLAWGALETESFFALGVIIISTLLNVAYLLPIAFRAFWMPENVKHLEHKEAPLPMVIAMVVTAAGTIWLMFCPGFVLDLAKIVVQ